MDCVCSQLDGAWCCLSPSPLEILVTLLRRQWTLLHEVMLTRVPMAASSLWDLASRSRGSGVAIVSSVTNIPYALTVSLVRVSRCVVQPMRLHRPYEFRTGSDDSCYVWWLCMCIVRLGCSVYAQSSWLWYGGCRWAYIYGLCEYGIRTQTAKSSG